MMWNKDKGDIWGPTDCSTMLVRVEWELPTDLGETWKTLNLGYMTLR